MFEYEDEHIGDAEAIDGCDRRRPADCCRVGGPLFNLEEKSSCRFSADAGSRIAPSNLWLIIQKAARGSPTARGGTTAEERPSGDGPALHRSSDMRVGLASAQMLHGRRRRAV
jgi:hypothetical protein